MLLGTTSIKGHTNSSSVLKRHGLRIRNKCSKSLCIIVGISVVLLIAISTTVAHLGQDLSHQSIQEHSAFFKQTVPQYCPYEPYYDIVADQSINFSAFGVTIINAFEQVNINIQNWFNNCSVISPETLLEIKKRGDIILSLISVCRCQLTSDHEYEVSLKLIKSLTKICKHSNYEFPEASLFIFSPHDNVAVSPKLYPTFGESLFNPQEAPSTLLFLPRSYFSAFFDRAFVENELKASYVNWNDKLTKVIWRGSCSGSPSFCMKRTLFEGNLNHHSIYNGTKCNEIDYGFYCNISYPPPNVINRLTFKNQHHHSNSNKLLNRWPLIEYDLHQKWNKNIIDMMDIKMVYKDWCDDKREYYKSTEYFSERISRQDILKYKFIVVMDGNSVADRLPYQFKYGSVIIKQASPNVEFWYYHLKNHQHFISYRTPQHLDDILTELQVDGFSSMEQMAQNGVKMINKHYFNETVISCFTSNMLHFYTDRLRTFLSTFGCIFSEIR
eukprot:471114_1